MLIIYREQYGLRLSTPAHNVGIVPMRSSHGHGHLLTFPHPSLCHVSSTLVLLESEINHLSTMVTQVPI